MTHRTESVAQVREWYARMTEMLRDVTADDPSQRATGAGEYDGEELGIGA